MSDSGGNLPSILRRILSAKKKRLLSTQQATPLDRLIAQLPGLPPARDFTGAIRTGGPARVIAEFKCRSPSRGELCRHFDIPSLHKAYEEGGADAYSVLTEEDHFGGSLEHLKTLRALTDRPILRKDFLLSPYQLYESRSAGADAVLLIAACLSRNELAQLINLSADLGLSALVEVHTDEELDTALGAKASIIGINNRNLHTFEVSLKTAVRLAKQIPAGCTVVSESGIRTREDIVRLEAAGIHAFLIGESLVTAADPSALLKDLKGEDR